MCIESFAVTAALIADSITIFDRFVGEAKTEDELTQLRSNLILAHESILKLQKENISLTDELEYLRKKLSIKEKYKRIRILGGVGLVGKECEKTSITGIEEMLDDRMDVLCPVCGEKKGLEIPLTEKVERATFGQRWFLNCPDCDYIIMIDDRSI